MTKKCPICNSVDIADNYGMCVSCNIKAKQSNQKDYLKDISENLKMCNWNFGAMQKWMKLSLLNDLEKNKLNLTRTQERIYNLLIKDLDKDFKAIEDIKKESSS